MVNIYGKHLYLHEFGIPLLYLISDFTNCALKLCGRTILYKAKTQTIRTIIYMNAQPPSVDKYVLKYVILILNISNVFLIYTIKSYVH